MRNKNKDTDKMSAHNSLSPNNKKLDNSSHNFHNPFNPPLISPYNNLRNKTIIAPYAIPTTSTNQTTQNSVEQTLPIPSPSPSVKESPSPNIKPQLNVTPSTNNQPSPSPQDGFTSNNTNISPLLQLSKKPFVETKKKTFTIKKSQKRKRINKYTTLSLEKLYQIKRRMQQELSAITKHAGESKRPAEVKDAELLKPSAHHWEELQKQGSIQQRNFALHLSDRKSQLALINEQISIVKRKSISSEKKKDDALVKERKKVAKSIAKMVRVFFWDKIKKLRELKKGWEEEEKQRDLFKERLDSFVEKNVKLTKQMAHSLTTPSADNAKEAEKMTDILQEFSKENSSSCKNICKPTGNTIDSCPVKVPIPKLLRFGTLRDYQRIGLDWLVSLHSNKMNGILADEMGLGKTIQTIALFAHLATAEENWGPHLLIVPTSVIVNWEMEFKRWLPGFKILSYYGTPKKRKQLRKGWETPNSFNVLITSYNLVVTDVKSFRRRNWEYLVLDEAHNIKNFRSRKWQALLNFNTSHRLLLSGTPLQNDLMELWSFLHFLMPSVFSSRLEFTQWFNCPMSELLKKNRSLSKSPVVKSLHAILRPFMLRRLKSDVATQLPSKKEFVIKCKLSLRQRRLYDDFMNEANTKEILERNNYYGMWSILMQLRKVCNHPDLFEGRPILSPLQLPAIKFDPGKHFLSVLKTNPLHSICRILFRNFADVNEETESHRYYQVFTDDKNAKKKVRKRKRSDSSVEELQSFLSGKNLLWAKPTEKIRTRSVIKSKEMAKKEKPLIYGENLIRLLYVRKMAQGKTPMKRSREMKEEIDNFVCVNSSARADWPEMEFGEQLFDEQKAKKQTKNVEKLVGNAQAFHNSRIRALMNFPDKRLIQWDCGKLQKLCDLLREQKSKGSRCLIFTQMSRMLDVLEAFLNIYGYRYFRLDGATKTDQRAAMMERFNRDESIFVFILSTRSGGYGINLTGANVVIFYDTDWNPAIDLQAQDRAHRIGQTRQVNIYRLISTNTVEENMLSIALDKRKMNKAIIGEGEFTTENLFKKSDVKKMLGISIQQCDDGKTDEDLPLEKTDQNDGAATMKMMSMVEDKEDQQTLQRALKEIKGEQPEEVTTAEEYTRQLESELSEIQLYGLNYDRSWVSIGGFYTKPEDESLTLSTAFCSLSLNQRKKLVDFFTRQFSLGGFAVNLSSSVQKLAEIQMPTTEQRKIDFLVRCKLLSPPSPLVEAIKKDLNFSPSSARNAKFNFDGDFPNFSSQIFNILFPSDKNAHKLHYCVESLRDSKELEQEPQYTWKTTKPIPHTFYQKCRRPEQIQRAVEVAPVQKSSRAFKRRSLKRKHKHAPPIIVKGDIQIKIPMKILRRKSSFTCKTRENATNEHRNTKRPRIKYKMALSWTPEEDSLLVAATSRYKFNWEAVQLAISSCLSIMGRMRSPSDCKNRYLVLTQRALPLNQRTKEATCAINMDIINKKHVESIQNANLQCADNSQMNRNLLKNNGIAFGSSEMESAIDRAMNSVSEQKAACKNAISLPFPMANSAEGNRSEMTQSSHPSHVEIAKTMNKSLGFPQNCCTILPKSILNFSKNARVEQLSRYYKFLFQGPSPNPHHPSFKSTEMKAMEDNNAKQIDEETHLVMLKLASLLNSNPSFYDTYNNTSPSLHDLIRYFVAMYPQYKFEVKHIFLRSDYNNYQKIKSVTDIFLKNAQ